MEMVLGRLRGWKEGGLVGLIKTKMITFIRENVFTVLAPTDDVLAGGYYNILIRKLPLWMPCGIADDLIFWENLKGSLENLWWWCKSLISYRHEVFKILSIPLCYHNHHHHHHNIINFIIVPLPGLGSETRARLFGQKNVAEQVNWFFLDALASLAFKLSVSEWVSD